MLYPLTLSSLIPGLPTLSLSIYFSIYIYMVLYFYIYIYIVMCLSIYRFIYIHILHSPLPPSSCVIAVSCIHSMSSRMSSPCLSLSLSPGASLLPISLSTVLVASSINLYLSMTYMLNVLGDFICCSNSIRFSFVAG